MNKTITAGTIVTVNVSVKDRSGRTVSTKTITGPVADGFTPDAAGEMLIRVRGVLRPCNISDVIEVRNA